MDDSGRGLSASHAAVVMSMDYVHRLRSKLSSRLASLIHSLKTAHANTSTTINPSISIKTSSTSSVSSQRARLPSPFASSRRKRRALHSRSNASSSEDASSRMHLTDLPYTIFLEIISYLPPAEAVSCRLVSRQTNQALTRSDLCISLILLHFPRSAEGRLLRGLLQDDEQEEENGQLQRSRELQDGDWAKVFARLARRYYHLGNATAWRTTKVRTLREETGFFRGVTPWNRFLRLEGRTAPFHYWDPVWSFAPKEGLLVYPEADDVTTGAQPPDGTQSAPPSFVWCPYRIRDLTTGQEVAVPFDVEGKVVRRVRLNDGILMFEWCEKEAFHALNEREAAHRHFATAYDVRREGLQSIIPLIERNTSLANNKNDTSSTEAPWTVTFRSEWKIHYLGLPLSHHDRFYSTHNSTHYVVYIWQPTRSPWGEENPLERLIIWEIGSPSTYRPSQDPSEKSKPPDSRGPRIIRRLINEELADWGVRQQDTPSLRGLALDECTWDERTESACGHVFFHEEDHRWAAGPHSTHTPPRIHRVKATGIPLVGDGPRWLDDCGGGGDDEISMSFCWRGPQRRAAAAEAVARAARYGGSKSYSSSLQAAAVAAKEEAWPGRAPCWRHDDFPYLTVSEVFDAAAGVRVSARQCFMMETLSVHVRPRLRVRGVEATWPRSRRRKNGDGTTRRTSSHDGGGSGDSSRASSRSGASASSSTIARRQRQQNGVRTPSSRDESQEARRAEGPDGEEVQFADEIWEEMLGKGYICGDERWLVGEDGKGCVTVLEF